MQIIRFGFNSNEHLEGQLMLGEWLRQQNEAKYHFLNLTLMSLFWTSSDGCLHWEGSCDKTDALSNELYRFGFSFLMIHSGAC